MPRRIFSVLLLVLVATMCLDAQQRKNVTVRIPLDPSGVSDFTFLNRANVPNVSGKAVEFYNATPDRTFIVKMPFVYKPEDLAFAFATAREKRGGKRLREIVCGALPPGNGRPPECREPVIADNTLDRIEELRIFLEALNNAKDPTIPDLATCLVTDASCLIQRTFAVAECRYCNLPNDFPAGLDRAAEEQLQLLIRKGEFLPAESCPLKIQSDYGVLAAEVGSGVIPRCANVTPPSSGSGVLDTIGADQARKAITNDLLARRFAMAKEALIKAVKKEASTRLDSLDQLRQQLEAAFTDAQSKAKTSLAQRNRSEYIERSAKLLASYSPDSVAPFPIRPPVQEKESVTQEARLEDARKMYVAGSVAPEFADAAGGGPPGDRGIDFECNPKDGTCVASAVVLPRQYARFSEDTLRHHGKAIITFSVEFFGLSSPPANANAYVALTSPSADAIDSIPSKFGIKLGMGGVTAVDVSNDFVGHYRHTSGTGTTAIEFAGGIVDASVSLRFKKGDFGGPDSTRALTVAQYQAKVSGPKNLILQFGQFEFANPSSGIALSETGEGVRLAYKKLALSHVIHRESDALDGKIDREDDDSYVGILELKNLVPEGTPILSGIDFSFAYGNNENDETPKDEDLTDTVVPTRAVPYTFMTFGSEVRFTFARLGDVNASLAVYHSQRNTRPGGGYTDVDLLNGVKDGRGTVGLLTFGWSFTRSALLFEKDVKARPTYGPTFTIGRGTSDKTSSGERDEGYLGENAGFSQDKIFLSAISVSKDFNKPDQIKIGEGLEGKWYAGVQWNDNRWSLLLPLARTFGDERTIVSYATIASLHSYWFADKREGASGSAGLEANVEFQLESPEKVTWTLGGAYYHRSRAVELAGLLHDPWQITASVTLSLKGP